MTSAALLAGQLVLEVHTSCPGFDHAFHQLEGIERPAEARFGIGHDRQKIVMVAAALQMLDLIRSTQRVVDAADDHRHAVGRVQALVGIHLTG
jgi:hypothetical protein